MHGFFKVRVSIREGLLGINRMAWACTYARVLFARKTRAKITKAINDNALATHKRMEHLPFVKLRSRWISHSSRRFSKRTDPADVLGVRGMAGVVQIPRELKVEPELRLDAEKLLQSKCGVRRHRAAFVDQFVEPRVGNPQLPRHLALGHTHGQEKLLFEHLARV